jgi:hypothetical protein
VTGAARDPVSVTMDRAARQLLARVYRADGAWASTRLADPTARQLAGWIGHGINVRAPDPVRGGFNARSRWARAFVRALWYQHKWYSSAPGGGGWRAEQRAANRRPGIQVEIGRALPRRGVIPPGRAVRVRLADPDAAERRGRPASEWSWAHDGHRRGDLQARDWPASG